MIPLFPPLAFDVPVKGVKEEEQEEDAGNYSNEKSDYHLSLFGCLHLKVHSTAHRASSSLQ